MNACSIFLRSADTHAGRPAIIDDRASITYADLHGLVNQAGRVLRDIGCVRGDRVLICLPDSIDFAAAFLGTMTAGAIPVPVSPRLTRDEYLHYLTDTAARVAIVERSVLSVMPVGGHQTLAVGGAATGQGVRSWNAAMQSTSAAALEPCEVRPEDLAMLLYTSGSTNAQKCVMHSHAAIASACRNVGAGVLGLTAEDRVLSVPKPFFSFGLGGGLLFPLSAGASTMVTNGSIDLAQIVRLIATRRPTILCAVPTFLSVLSNAHESLDVNLSSLRFIVSAGEPLDRRLFEVFRTRFDVEVVDGIGSTEMLTHFITNYPGRSCPGSCGTEVPECEVMLVDERGAPVPTDEVGSLLVKAPTAFLGYWQDPQATERVRSSSWVKTGDTLYRDGHGRYFFVGRNDDMLKIGGVWIAPREIEQALLTHDNIAYAVVTTREDDTGKRRLVAYVLPKAGEAPSAVELLRFIRSKVPPHMIPAAFVALSEIPRTGNGKLSRRGLPSPKWPALEGARLVRQ
jgi:acyl-coenzyme A synthetase/AMP-(fatty) acid ligase